MVAAAKFTDGKSFFLPSWLVQHKSKKNLSGHPLQLWPISYRTTDIRCKRVMEKADRQTTITRIRLNDGHKVQTCGGINRQADLPARNIKPWSTPLTMVTEVILCRGDFYWPVGHSTDVYLSRNGSSLTKVSNCSGNVYYYYLFTIRTRHWGAIDFRPILWSWCNKGLQAWNILVFPLQKKVSPTS